MIGDLVPCAACKRHILASETACPFCRAEARSTPILAAIVLSAGLALAGCGEQPQRQPAIYGGPPPIVPPPTAPTSESVDDAGAAPAPTPAMDAGAPAPRDAGAAKSPPQPQLQPTMAPAYGAPPPRKSPRNPGDPLQ